MVSIARGLLVHLEGYLGGAGMILETPRQVTEVGQLLLHFGPWSSMAHSSLVNIDLFQGKQNRSDRSHIPWITVKAPLKRALNQSVGSFPMGFAKALALSSAENNIEGEYVIYRRK